MVLVPAPEAELGQVWREPQETNPFTQNTSANFLASGIIYTFVSPYLILNPQFLVSR